MQSSAAVWAEWEWIREIELAGDLAGRGGGYWHFGLALMELGWELCEMEKGLGELLEL